MAKKFRGGAAVISAAPTRLVTLHFVVADRKHFVTAARALKTRLVTTYFPQFRSPKACWEQAKNGHVTFTIPEQLKNAFLKNMTTWIDGAPTWKLGKFPEPAQEAAQ